MRSQNTQQQQKKSNIPPKTARAADGDAKVSQKRGEPSAAMIEDLNTLLADQWIMLMKSLNYHWNIEGIQFREIHKLLEDMYEEVFESIDQIAERVRALGGRPLGAIGAIPENARLKDATGTKRQANEMLQDLLNDLEALNRTLREGIKRCEDETEDYGTCDLMTDLLRGNEKQAWMLRASIQQ